MSICNFCTAAFPKTPFVILNDRKAIVRLESIIIYVFTEKCGRSIDIYIRTLHIFASKHTHTIASIWAIKAITYKEIVISISISIFKILNISPFTTNIIATTYMDPHVFITGHGTFKRCTIPFGFIAIKVITKPCRFIEF